MTVSAESTKTPNREKLLRILIPVILLAIGIAGYYLFHSYRYESTDDATIAADVTDVSAQVPGEILRVHVRANQEAQKGDLLAEIDPKDYEARLSEAKAALKAAHSSENGAEINKTLTEVTSQAGVVQESADVRFARAGVRTARLVAKQAEAQYAAAQADAGLAQSELRRNRQLAAKDEISKQQVDRAQADADRANANLKAAGDSLRSARSRIMEARSQLGQAIGRFRKVNVVKEQVKASETQLESAKSQVEQAKAALQTAELNLSYTQIRAPISGRVTNKTVEPGNYVQPGQIVLSIVPRDVWVVANFKETQLMRIRPGQQADIRVDAYRGKVFRGHVDSIQAGTGSAFSLLPPENATGNYVKVVQRVPVKIVFDEAIDPHYELTPGMSVLPEVKVK